MRDICNLMDIFRVTYAIVDWGFGYDRYKKLVSIFGKGRVGACYYSFNQRQERKYDPDKARWVVNRTDLISKYIRMVETKEIIWPGSQKGEYSWLFDHHLCEMAEYRKTQSGRSEDLMYTHPEGQPDDGMHSGVYAMLAEIVHGQVGSGSIQFAGYTDINFY